MGGKDAGGLWESSPLKVRWHLRVLPPHLSVPTPKEGNKPLSCFKVQLSRKDIVKEIKGILLILKAQRFQAITSISVSRKVEGISMLHLVCPLLPSSSSPRGKGEQRVCECFSKVELLLASAALVQKAMFRAWFVGSLGQDYCSLGCAF